MDSTKHLDDLAQIRSVMERSTRFLSISPMAAVLAGIYALVGAYAGYRIIYNSPVVIYETLEKGFWNEQTLPLFLIAGAVLTAATLTGLITSYQKAKAAGQSLWTRSGIRLGINFMIPMAAGGVFILILLMRGYFGLLASATLLFYGFALLNAGNFTFSDIRTLGILEIILGLLAAAFPGRGLIFWAVGFGVLHIVYGGIMYFKYEKSGDRG